MKTEKVLLTGATGFLGSHLLKALLASGYQVIIIKRRSSDISRIHKYLDQILMFDSELSTLHTVFTTHQISTVIHAACNYGRDKDDFMDVVRTNLLFGLDLLNLAKYNGVTRFINIDTALDRHLNSYTLSKKQLLEWLRRESSSVQCINLRLEHMYGPGDDNKKFLPWIVEQFASKAPHIDLTAGQQLRDFIYIDDVVAAVLLVLKKSNLIDQYCSFDVASGNYTTIESFVRLVKSLYENLHGDVSTSLNFGAIPYRAGEQMKIEVDNGTLLALGWKPQVGLESGVKKTLEEI